MERLEEALAGQWEYLLTLLPEDLEQSAREAGAFQRKRHIQCAGDLLRIILAYSLSGFSFRTTSAWAKESGLAQVSDTDIIKRMKKSEVWLGRLLQEKLRQRLALSQAAGVGKIQVLDSTLVRGRENWRIHASLDLEGQKMRHVSLTSWTEAESFAHYPIQPGELLVADRGFAHHRNIAKAQKDGALVLVRMHWKSLVLIDVKGNRIRPLVVSKNLKNPGDMLEASVFIQENQRENLPALAGRLIIIRKSPEATAKSLKKLKRRASRRINRLQPQTLQSTQIICLFTTAPREMLDAKALAELYQFRWQIELLFKRLKSLANLDEMTVHHPCLCRVVLTAKLLGALMVEELTDKMTDGFFYPPQGTKYLSLAALSIPNGRHANRPTPLDSNPHPALSPKTLARLPEKTSTKRR